MGQLDQQKLVPESQLQESEQQSLVPTADLNVEEKRIRYNAYNPESGKTVGKDFEFPTMPDGCNRVVELHSGYALLALGEDDSPLGMIYAPVVGEQMEANFMSFEQFDNQFGYGLRIDPDKVMTLIDPTNVQRLEYAQWFHRKDVNTLSIQGRIALLPLLDDPERYTKLLNVVDWNVGRLIHLLGIFTPEELEGLGDMDPRKLKVLETVAVATSYIGMFPDAFIDSTHPDFQVLPRVMVAKIKDIFTEFAKSDVLNEKLDDIVNFTNNSINSVAHLYEINRSLLDGGRYVVDESTARLVHPESFYDVLNFIRENPQLRHASNAVLEFLLSVYILRQNEDPTFELAQREKPLFYAQFNQGDSMNETTPTTNSEVDIARARSAFEQVWGAMTPENHALEMTTLLLGIGNGKRFEGPLVQQLLAMGINLKFPLKAFDLNDLSSEFPDSLADRVDIVIGDVTAKDFVFPKSDIAVLPWSMPSDILTINGEREFLKKLEASETGHVIWDVPLPIGEHSYERKIREDMDKFGVPGTLERGFDLFDGTEIHSMFIMMDFEVLLNIFAEAGYTVINFKSYEEAAKLLKQIMEDDSVLGQMRDSKADHDIEQPFYQTMTPQGVKANRMTLLLKQVGQEEAYKRLGGNPSLLSVMERNRMSSKISTSSDSQTPV